MIFDDFDDDYDDIGTMLIMDEMDREDETVNGGGGSGTGCLSTFILLIAFPAIFAYLFLK